MRSMQIPRLGNARWRPNSSLLGELFRQFLRPKEREQGYEPLLSSMAKRVVIIFRFLFPLDGRLLEYVTAEGE
jgi:hypothetical protein